MGELATLPNIGKDTENRLNSVGIMTVEQLREIGSKKAWLMLRTLDDTACLHRLYGLEGAVQGVKKSALSPETKRELKEFFDSFS
jgi:DNA transformation protein